MAGVDVIPATPDGNVMKGARERVVVGWQLERSRDLASNQSVLIYAWCRVVLDDLTRVARNDAIRCIMVSRSRTLARRVTNHSLRTAFACVLESLVTHLGEDSLKLGDVRATKLVVLREEKVSELAPCLIVRELGDFAD
ncbi:hypothetical protein CWO90_36040 [Bradyrhizobium sp. Leo121]|nr:hypothetical protein CWO90_36040 [Bradyrhizobium sp. Leo121]